MRRRVVNTARHDRILLVLSGFLSCIGAISISALLFSLIAANLDLSDGVINVMSSISLCAGCLSGGYSVAKRRRKNGLLTGVICGIIIFFCVLLTGIVFVRVFTIMGFITKFIIIIACAAIGGVIGVNSTLRIR